MDMQLWADNYGLWSARVPKKMGSSLSGLARQARSAIEAELKKRGEIGEGYHVKVAFVSQDDSSAVFKEV